VAPRIEPRTLKGFADELPERAIVKERCIELSKRVFCDFGFAPIETPALEYSEVLLGKLDQDAEMQRQIYRFRDHGDRDVALRFDLTVPFARFAAQHRQTIGMPFRRYHIAPVWRGENPQAGRQREFLQCDIDVIGTASPVADGEVLGLVCQLMTALGVDRYELRINDRQLLRSRLAAAGVTVGLEPVLRAIDKLDKQGPAAVARDLEGIGLSPDAVSSVLEVCGIRGRAFDLLEDLGADAERLRDVVAIALAAGADGDKVMLDLSIARGLDYYTSTVFETFLVDLPAIGSICSGGRYDDLAALYAKEPLPGVGASLGLTRLLDAWEQLGVLDAEPSTPAHVLVLQFADSPLASARIARTVRDAGVATEVYPDAKKLAHQLRYAERKGHRAAILYGPDEQEHGVVKIRDMRARSELTVDLDDLVKQLTELLR
jgi:histidyl-tRNA synthetase